MKLEQHITVSAPMSLIEALSSVTPLSKSAIKRALTFGGAWVQPQGTGKKQRCRKATRALNPGDKLSFYYDDGLYNTNSLSALPILQNNQWGVWWKPVNVVAQGTPYGDRGSMEDQVRELSGQQQVHIIHRLDREVSGLMLIAYNKDVAATLSRSWNTAATQKTYQAWVTGTPDKTGEICLLLDGKPAFTRYRVLHQETEEGLIEIQIGTGRYHQIRRHFSAIGHPVVGDPRYGSKNKNAAGLQLEAYHLCFTCPVTQQSISCEVPATLRVLRPVAAIKPV